MQERQPTILDDLGASLAAWVQAPLLLTIAVVIAVAEPALARAGAIGALASSLVLLFRAGWVGTERVWYMRVFRGSSFPRSDVWRFVPAFMGRFIVLGLIVGAPLMAIFAVWGSVPPVGRLSPSALWVLIIGGVLADFALTFVAPALAFTTRSVKAALRIGIGMIRAEWPRSAPYVLIPPLAIQIVLRAVPPRQQLDRPVWLGAAIASSLVGFAFKGAIARFDLHSTRRVRTAPPSFRSRMLRNRPDQTSIRRTIPRPSHLTRIRLLESTISQEDECSTR